MFDASRRRLLIHALGYGASFGPLLASVTPARAAQSGLESDAAAPSLRTMLRDPLLVRSLYRLPVSREFSPDGAAGTNRNGYQWIEEQRQGAEWIVRAYAQNNREWMQTGWRELDWGLGRQQPDGGFASKDGFHSTSFFVEALARSCLIDPDGASTPRVEGLVRAARWLMRADVEEKGARSNNPYTHRRYLLAAALGQAGAVSGDKALLHRAEAWAEDGLRLQRDDGTNPEKDGYDVGYQMVGVLSDGRRADGPALSARLPYTGAALRIAYDGPARGRTRTIQYGSRWHDRRWRFDTHRPRACAQRQAQGGALR
jgi:hypothetical protein